MTTPTEVPFRPASTGSTDQQPEEQLSNDLVILIVDDDPDMRMYIRGCLRQLKPTRILEAHNGRHALDISRGTQPSLIISDSIMPELDGQGLCLAVRSDDDLANIPILLISGKAGKSTDLADGFLAKPFNTLILLTEIERILGRPN